MNKRKTFLNVTAIMIVFFAFALLFIDGFATSFRLLQSLKYLGIDFYHYFLSLFTKVDFNYPRMFDYIIHNYDNIDLSYIVPLPEDFSNFLKISSIFFRSLVNRFNFQTRLIDLLFSMIIFFQLLYFVVILSIPAKMLFNSEFAVNELSFDDKSKMLRFSEKFNERITMPILRFITDTFKLISSRKYYIIPLVIFLGISTNIFTIIIDLTAFLFFFSSSFNVMSIFHVLYTTLFTMYPLMIRIPLVVYLLVAFILFKMWQKNKAIERLYHLDNMNKGFAKSLGVVTSVVAPPRAGKTTTLVALAMDFEEIFRSDFLSILETHSAYFPDFPWSQYEKMLSDNIKANALPNRYAIRPFVASIFYQYEQTNKFPFSYDLKEDKVICDVGNALVFLQESLITYGEAYYYYSYPGSLISSNFSNRADFYKVQHNDKFPLFVFPALTIDPYSSYELTHYSKNINFDSFRVFKRIQEDVPPLTDVGIYLEMESSKQWGNQFDNKEFKRGDDKANPNNDGFAFFLSSFAHASLIDYQPFIKYIMDFQRVGDLAVKFAGMAETRATIIPNEADLKIALPLYNLAPIFYEFLISIRKKLYTRKYRTFRDDRTFLFNFINQVGSWATRQLKKATNNYGFKVNQMTLTSGNEDAGNVEFKPKSYFIIHKKHYSDRFRSDALKAMYEDATRTGFLGFESFTSLDMSSEDLKKQNSYAVLNRFNTAQNSTQDESAPLGLSDL